MNRGRWPPIGRRRSKSRLRSGKAVRAVGRQRPDAPAARGDKLRRDERWWAISAQEAVAAAPRWPAVMRATGRSRTGRSRARDGPASAARAVPRRRCGRSERRRPGKRRCPAAPARSWRGEGSGTRPQAKTRQTRLSVSAFGERSRFAQPLAAPALIQSARVESLALRPVAGKHRAAELAMASSNHPLWRVPLHRALPPRQNRLTRRKSSLC